MPAKSNPGLAWHPLRALTRTDAGLTTCFHSFYALEAVDSQKSASAEGEQQEQQAQVRVVLRVPEQSNRKYIKDLENILRFEFLTYVKRDGGDVEQKFGTFSLTLYNSKRYNAFWRSDAQSKRFLVGISMLPVYSVSRQVFAQLEVQEGRHLLPILAGLCEAPILPACGLKYELRFPSGSHVPVRFSPLEQLDDADIFLVAMQVLNPRMLILAWESLLLERHVLVVSSLPALIGPCCEFLKRLVLPMAFVGSYVPYLLDPEFIEAPVPYLQGVSTQRLRNSGADLSDVVVVDLDAGFISIPSSENAQCAPPSLLSALLQELNPLWSQNVAAWVGRANDCDGGPARHPLDPQALADKANAVIQIFVQQNLSLLSARTCFIRAFSRRPAKFKGVDVFGLETDTRLSARVTGELDICFNTSPGGQIKSGALLLLQSGKRSIQVWVESDSSFLAVYRYEDELPMLLINSEDMRSIVGIPQEPEGHIFEIVGQGATYRFQAADPEARLKWISLVDGIIQRHREKEARERERENPIVKEKTLFGFGEAAVQDEASHRQQSGAASHASNTTHSPGSAVHSRMHGETAHSTNIKYYNHLVNSVGNSVNSARSPFASALPVLSPEDDEEMMTAFKALFLRTQMVAYLDAQIERGEGATYEALFEKLGSPPVNYEIASSFCASAASEQGQVLISPESRISAVLETYISLGCQTLVDTPRPLALPPAAEGPVCMKKVAFDEPQREKLLSSSAIGDGYGNGEGGVGDDDGTSGGSAPSRRKSAPVQSSPPASSAASACSKCGQDVKRRPSGGFLNFFLPARRECEACAGHSPQAHDETAEDVGSDEASIKWRAFESAKRESSSFLARVALSHQACEEELHGGIMDVRIEVAADLVQYYAKVQRGEVPHVPIVLEVGPAAPAVTAPSVMTHPGLFPGLWASAADYEPGGGTSDVKKQTPTPLQQASLSMRESLLGALSAQLDAASTSNSSHLQPILQTLLGHLHEAQGSFETAMDMYAGGCLVDQERIMACLVASLIKDNRPPASPEAPDGDAASAAVANPSSANTQEARCAFVFSFLRRALDLSPLIGLQAYRLLAQLVHRHTITKLLEVFQDDPQEQQKQNQELQSQLEELSPFLSRCGLAGKTEENSYAMHRHRESFIRNSAKGVFSSKISAAIPGQKTDASILNETYSCSSSVHSSDPCKLSHFLVARLNELVSVYCQTHNGSKFARRTTHGHTRIAISPQGDGQVPIREIRSQSAFHDFEIQVCELQRTDLSRLSSNAEKTVFWVNIYNCLCMHGILLRGTPGTNKFERFNFMKIKYRIGPLHTFSMFEIEHGMLRSASAKPSSFALLPLSPFPIFSPIAEKDPRRQFALSERMPLINFVLFTASNFSPPFSGLQNAANVHSELAACAREYIRCNVRVRRSDLTVVLPCMFYLYWSDFGSGGNATVKTDVVKLLLRHAPSPIKEALEDVVRQHPVSGGGRSHNHHSPHSEGVLGVAVAAMTAEKSRANLQFKFLFDPLSFEPVMVVHTPG